jgi:outer membrane beta-barrel protein
MWAHLAIASTLLLAAPDMEGIEASALADILSSELRPEHAVVQKRRYALGQELHLALGSLPVDAFYKGFTATVGYTVHLNNTWALELGEFTYALNVDTKLRDEVLRFRQAEFPEVQWVAASRLVFKPLYGKQALFNTSVVYVEGYAQLGATILKRTDAERKLRPGTDLGVGVRLWLQEGLSMRLELGEMIYFAGRRNGFDHALTLRGALAFSTQGDG